HQNVSVAPLCKGAVAQAACQLAGAAYPNVLTALANGGPLLLDDGQRIDSYARVLRWLNNRVPVRAGSVRAVTAALGSGAGYGVFAVLGEPGAVDLWAEGPAGHVGMGQAGDWTNAVISARLPDLPAPELGAQWTPDDAARAELRAVLWRTTVAGRTQVA